MKRVSAVLVAGWLAVVVGTTAAAGNFILKEYSFGAHGAPQQSAPRLPETGTLLLLGTGLLGFATFCRRALG